MLRTRGIAFIAVLAVVYGVWRYRADELVVESGTVLITGTSSGIGQAAAVYLSQRFHVVATVRKEQDAEAFAGSSRIFPVVLDVGSAASVTKAHASVVALLKKHSLPPLVAVVNNAGVSGGGAPIELDEEDNVRRVMEVNFFGALRVTQAFLPELRASGGRVVTVSSIKGSISTPGSGGYCASKAAVNALMTALDREVRHLGMRSVIVEPGYIATAILSNIQPDLLRRRQELAASSVGQAYPGFARYLATIQRSAAGGGLSRGVPVEVCNRAIEQAIAARWPSRLIRAGGPEVYSAGLVEWLPLRLQDLAADLVFRYGQGEDSSSSWLHRAFKVVGG